MGRLKGSKLGKFIKIASRIIVIFLLFIVVLFFYGVHKRGLHQEEYLEYPNIEIPVKLPRDFAAHPDYKTEWWYYTGHLEDKDGRRYGYELTFFRIRTVNMWAYGFPVWWFIYPHGMACHLAITDIGNKKHYLADAIQKNSSDNVGAKTDTFHVWLRNWYAKSEGSAHHLFAMDRNLGIDLILNPTKPPTLHGKNGYHWKGVDGIPSNYISFTRMKTQGTIQIGDRKIDVDGTTWMDHEYTSFKPKKTTQGWDWFAIQMENDYDIMLYQLHKTDGTLATDSTGSIIDPYGKVQAIRMPEYSISSIDQWKSPESGVTYPLSWRISMPEKGIFLDITPYLPNQEMIMKTTDVIYWEGACSVKGQWEDSKVNGRAYVELTGYHKPVGERF